MFDDALRARAVALPSGSRIAALFAGADLADAFAIQLPPDSSRDVATLTQFMLGDSAPWVNILMAARDTIVAPFGLKTTGQLRVAPLPEAAHRIAIFRVYATYADEMILGEDDTHLDFRTSVLLRSMTIGGTTSEIVTTTAVHCHNALGRAYLMAIAPFHRRVVRSMLQRAARRGWPKDTPK